MSMTDVTNHKHEFFIGEMKVVLLINRINGLWTCKVIEGDTGIGGCSGGKYPDLEAYIKDQEREHRYCYNFFNKGYAYAKQHLDPNP